MIRPAALIHRLRSVGVDLFTGVPDSLMRGLCDELAFGAGGNEHVVAANEGGAVAIAMGHYLATGRPAFVYMQNSGIGNAVNPLLSLADPEVYGIPMLVLIGWRGRPGEKDEPQHVKQGRVMPALLDALDLPWSVLPKDEPAALDAAAEAHAAAVERQSPSLLLVEKDSFAPAETPAPPGDSGLPSREEAVIALLNQLGPEPVVVATTGMLGREVYEHRRAAGGGERDLLVVGGMGHAASIAVGIARAAPRREVWCLDGDGAVLMHAGSLAVLASAGCRNLFHAVFNNGVHDSVGGQPSAVAGVSLPDFARALGYHHAATLAGMPGLPAAIAGIRAGGGPALLELRVRPGNRAGIGRPQATPRAAKEVLMANLRP